MTLQTPPLPVTTLGDNLEVSAQGYGGMSLTDVYGPISDADALATLRHAVEIGVTFIDTSNLYGLGRSERTIAKLYSGHSTGYKRGDLQIASKFGIVPSEGVGRRGINGHPEYVHEQIDLTLQRLETDYVDLYYQHRVDPDVPIEETVGAMAELVTAGKVLHLGLSEATGEEIRRAASVHPIAAVQSEWSIFSRDVERQVIPAIRDVGAAAVPYSPLGRGFFAASFDPAAIGKDDSRQFFPRFAPEHLAANEPLRQQLLAFAVAEHLTGPQLALAWLQQQAAQLGIRQVAIPGTRFAHRIDENVAALKATLSASTMAALDGFAARVSGGRSNDPNWVSWGRE